MGSASNTEVIGWVRSGYYNKGVGELGLAYAEQIAFARKNFNFMALHISQKNKASRRVAEKAGFKPVLRMAYVTAGSNQANPCPLSLKYFALSSSCRVTTRNMA